jgi:hypothetical protein
MEYLLKASAIITIFFLIYKILLQRETFFELNRWFLLIGLVAAFLLPFIVIPIYVEATPLDFSGYIFETPMAPENTEKPFNLLDYLPLIYGLGVVSFSIRFIVQFTSLALVFIKNKGEKIDGYRFIKTTHNISPFSFFNWIVYNPIPFSETELEQIITHEKVHAKQSHSFDILITHISCVVLWFNPFIWLYNKDLKQNLEFIADAVTATKTNCKKSYQYTLLKTSMPSHQMALSNPFYNSLIKKRIVMLHKSKSKKINQLKYALVIPALALFLMSFNTEEVYIQEVNNRALNPDNSKDIKIIFNKDITDNDLEKTKSELKKDSINFTYTNLKRNEKEEIVSITTKFQNERGSAIWNAPNTKNEPIKSFYFFKTEKTIGVSILDKEKHVVIASDDGEKREVAPSVSKKKAVIISSDDNDNTPVKEEIIIKNGDGIQYNKNPGSQLKPWKVTIGSSAVSSDTINWKPTKKRVGLNWVSDDNNKINIKSENQSKVEIVSSDGKDPLIILNGKEISSTEMKKLNPESIESINVLKDENVTKKYGDKGKDGVLLITTKEKNKSSWKISKERNNIVYTTKDTIYVNEKPNILKKAANDFNKQPLFILDGEEITKKDLNLINDQNIESLSTIQGGEQAIKEFGKKAKNGVIVIKTKNKNTKNPFVKVINASLYILDGKEIRKEAFEKLNPDKIASVNVLKGDHAIKKYGDKGKHGVIEITTKKK